VSEGKGDQKDAFVEQNKNRCDKFLLPYFSLSRSCCVARITKQFKSDFEA
jgi:hypothetical protein